MQAGEWWHSIDHDEPCRVVDTDTLWGQATCVVWLPRRGTAVRVLQKRLAPLKLGESNLIDRLSYVSAAARIADALERDALVAPLEGTVTPLPHQLLALQRAIFSEDRQLTPTSLTFLLLSSNALKLKAEYSLYKLYSC